MLCHYDHIWKTVVTVEMQRKNTEGNIEAERITGVVNDDWQLVEFARDQREDHDLRQLMNWKQPGLRLSWNDIATGTLVFMSYKAQRDSIIIYKKVMKRVLEYDDGIAQKKQLLIP